MVARSSRRSGALVAVLVAAAAAGALPAPAQDADRPKALARAFNATGQALFKELAAEKGNLVFSPYSVGAAMAMALAGAGGDTRKQMLDILVPGLPANALGPASSELAAAIRRAGEAAPGAPAPAAPKAGAAPKPAAPPSPMEALIAKTVQPPEAKTAAPASATEPPVLIEIANGLALTKLGKELSRAYRRDIAKTYGAEVFGDVKSVEPINAWVAQKTRGKIDKLLDQLDPNAVAVLLNAVYFKGEWLNAFDPKSTADAPFHLTAAEEVPVATMRQTAHFAAVLKDDLRAVRLPYQGERVAMVLAVPEKIDGIDAVAAAMDAPRLAALVAELDKVEPINIALSLPRFKAATGVGLVEPFRKLGLALPFDMDKADFSVMMGRKARLPGLAITDIAHKAVIEVDEVGSRAAAATGVVMTTRALGHRPEPFKVDRPFLFYIVEKSTGAVLFQGRIADPR